MVPENMIMTEKRLEELGERMALSKDEGGTKEVSQ
jgi:hypothetical protein